MKFKDSFRAQYYLQKLLQGRREIEDEILKLQSIWPKICARTIAEKICEQLAYQVDQIILPTVVYEIVLAGKLQGVTSEIRYQNFFLQNYGWTNWARLLPKKYPFLFEMIDIMIQSTFCNIKNILQRLRKDYLDLKKTVLIKSSTPLVAIRFGISDRHRNGQQTAILLFSSGEKLIYKPVNLIPNILFAGFINALKLEAPFDLRIPNVLSRKDYGWVEFVCSRQCQSIAEIRNFYRRAGVLLAIADTLNYCDGHMENVIACSDYPILVDLETLFHVFGEIDPNLGERSILFTGLVEKPPQNEDDKGFTAAFQALGVNCYELLYPHAINDHTDKIEVRYRGFSSKQADNSPVFNKAIQTPLHYIGEFISGYKFGYNRISDQAEKLLNEERWWTILKRAKTRQLIRHTLYYELLIRKIQQPKGNISEKNARDIIYPLLFAKDQKLSTVTGYEIEEILKLDIPYFYHFPESLDLYNGNGEKYPYYFKRCTIEEIRNQIKNKSKEYLRRNIEIIKNVLQASPKPI